MQVIAVAMKSILAVLWLNIPNAFTEIVRVVSCRLISYLRRKQLIATMADLYTSL